MVDKYYYDGMVAGAAIRDEDGHKIASTYTKYYTSTNPALTSSSSVCTWTVTHNLGTAVSIDVYNASTGGEVLKQVTALTDTQATIQLFSTTNIASGTYKVVVIGK